MPTVHVVFADVCKQRLVAGASFLDRHNERFLERAGDRFRIIRIDQQGAPEIDCGAGKARKDEDARIVRILGGNIFFRNEVEWQRVQLRDRPSIGRRAVRAFSGVLLYAVAPQAVA